jgi:hypothetical protein
MRLTSTTTGAIVKINGRGAKGLDAFVHISQGIPFKFTKLGFNVNQLLAYVNVNP